MSKNAISLVNTPGKAVFILKVLVMENNSN